MSFRLAKCSAIKLRSSAKRAEESLDRRVFKSPLNIVIREVTSVLTVNGFKEVMPRSMHNRITQSLVDNVNNLQGDPEFQEMYRENLVSYTSVMKEGRFKMESYLDAVRYVCFKLTGDSNQQAYKRAFPDRIKALRAKGKDDHAISKYVHAYSKNQLVNLIYDQTAIPFHVYNQDVRQRALMVQVDLMENAKSEKVKSEAANSVLTHLKSPENNKLEIEVGVKDSGAIMDLQKAVQDLTMVQREAIASKTLGASEVAGAKLVIDGSCEEV